MTETTGTREGTVRDQLSTRFWTESALSMVSTALLIVTLVWRTWIESVFGVDPDAAGGTAEWVITGVVLAMTVSSIYLARREWLRHQPVSA